MLTYTLKQIRISLQILGIFTILLGFIYPLAITVIAQLFFGFRANGSLIERGDKYIGSLLIGQTFTDAGYFWGRPSATKPAPYNSLDSSGSNLAPGNPVFLAMVAERIRRLQAGNDKTTVKIPVDLVTASASGLDPHISLLSALYQVPRVAKARAMEETQVENLIYKISRHGRFNILGEPCVNVLRLNLALDDLDRRNERKGT